MMLTRSDFAEFINEKGYRRGVEVGVDFGEYSYHLLKYSNLEQLFSVDSWRRWPDHRPFAMLCLERFHGRSTIVHSASADASKIFPDAHFDFIYIDAGHSYGQVKNDLKHWFPKLRVGGTMAGHDYVLGHRGCGVIPAVNEFMSTRDEHLHTTKDYLTSWYFIREN